MNNNLKTSRELHAEVYSGVENLIKKNKPPLEKKIEREKAIQTFWGTAKYFAPRVTPKTLLAMFCTFSWKSLLFGCTAITCLTAFINYSNSVFPVLRNAMGTISANTLYSTLAVSAVLTFMLYIYLITRRQKRKGVEAKALSERLEKEDIHLPVFVIVQSETKNLSTSWFGHGVDSWTENYDILFLERNASKKINSKLTGGSWDCYGEPSKIDVFKDDFTNTAKVSILYHWSAI